MTRIAIVGLLVALMGCDTDSNGEVPVSACQPAAVDGGAAVVEKTSVRVPAAEWSPQRLTFLGPEIGASEERLVRVENRGAGTLVLHGFEGDFSDEFSLRWYTGRDDDAVRCLGIEGGHRSIDWLAIAPGEALTFVLIYAPSGVAAAAGGFEMQSNDPNAQSIVIPIETAVGGPQIVVRPSEPLDFAMVAAGDSKRMSLRVINVGVRPLSLLDVQVSGSQDFGVRIDDGDPIADAALLADPDGDGAAGLSPGAEVELTVVYTPQTAGPDSAELTIRSSDPDRAEVVVSLTGSGA